MKEGIKVLFSLLLVCLTSFSYAQIFEVDVKIDQVRLTEREPINLNGSSVTVRFTEVSEIITIGRIADYLIGVQFEVLESKSLQSPFLIRETFFTRPDRNELWTLVENSNEDVVFHQLIGNHREITGLAFITRKFEIQYSLTIYKKSDNLKNYFYGEAGGNGFFGSINYERQLTKKPGLGIRMGIGVYPEYYLYLTFPVSVNYLIPIKRKSYFIETSFGYTFARTWDGRDSFENLVPSVGFRKHYRNKVMFRASLTPCIYISSTDSRQKSSGTIVPWAGFSIGKAF